MLGGSLSEAGFAGLIGIFRIVSGGGKMLGGSLSEAGFAGLIRIFGMVGGGKMLGGFFCGGQVGWLKWG